MGARDPRTGAQVPRIQVLARADALLEAVFERGGVGVALSELAAATMLNKVTAHNLLRSLAALRYLEQEPSTRRWRPGPRMLELGRRAQLGDDLARLCERALARLCRESGETVNLAVPYLGHALIVDSVEGRHGVRTTAYAGARSAYHASACGKAILAFLPAAQRRAFLGSRPLERLTPRTMVRPAQLERECALVRRRGYALDLEENEIGAHCVAVPVFDAGERVCGAISVSGLKDRLPPQWLEGMAQRIGRETAAIEHQLGRGRARVVA